MRLFVAYTGMVILLFFTVVALLPALIRSGQFKNIIENIDDAPVRSTAIILGASVINGEPSPVLRARVDTAITLLHKSKVTTIFVTGDGQGPYYNEVHAVLKYLQDAGVSTSTIMFDSLGINTFESMRRAHDIYGIQDAIIVTQDFHLPRALMLAKIVGISAVGVPADMSTSNVYNYIREIAADVKAVLESTRYQICKSHETDFLCTL